jgi:hypothetical protein
MGRISEKVKRDGEEVIENGEESSRLTEETVNQSNSKDF